VEKAGRDRDAEMEKREQDGSRDSLSVLCAPSCIQGAGIRGREGERE